MILSESKTKMIAQDLPILEQLCDNAPVGLGLLDTEFRFLRVNKKLAEINGLPVAEQIGRSLREVLPEMALKLEPIYTHVIESGEPALDLEMVGERASAGVIKHCLMSCLPIKNQHGTVEVIATVVQDITSRKQIEQALRESEERFRTICEHAPIMIDAFDREGRCLFVNTELEKTLGWTMQEIAGTQDILALVYPDAEQLERAKRSIQRADGRFREYKPVVKDGSIRTQMWADFRLPSGASISVGYDITKLKQVEDDLREANELLEKRVANRTAELKKALKRVERLKARLEAENIYFREEFMPAGSFDKVVGDSSAIKEVLSKAESVASTDATVLLLGKTGTGKELIANAIHSISHLSDKPLVKVNCASLPPNLIETELFGHERGAFTGAHATKQGRFELADGGTIFLDEIGDLPLELQSKLLRVLQAGEFERVGSTFTRKVKVRVLAATNRDLLKALSHGSFREDLYFRLNVFPITIPSLLDRKEDIPMLARHFVEKYAQKYDKKVGPIGVRSLKFLTSYSWPGNVRELENVIERAVIISGYRNLRIDESLFLPQSHKSSVIHSEKLTDVEREHILRILGETNWIIEGKRGAALRLGINPGTLRSRMQRLGIVRPK